MSNLITFKPGDKTPITKISSGMNFNALAGVHISRWMNYWCKSWKSFARGITPR